MVELGSMTDSRLRVLQPKLVALHSGIATTEGGLYGLCGQNGCGVELQILGINCCMGKNPSQ